MTDSEIQNACALRFNGYEYVDGTNQDFEALSKQIIEKLKMHEDPLENFAVFFGLQRYLCKWGGEQLPSHSPERIAFDRLYLHLYSLDTPAAYAHDQYNKKWCSISLEHREDCAQKIRSRLALCSVHDHE